MIKAFYVSYAPVFVSRTGVITVERAFTARLARRKVALYVSDETGGSK
jgi:hypothetical protein